MTSLRATSLRATSLRVGSPRVASSRAGRLRAAGAGVVAVLALAACAGVPEPAVAPQTPAVPSPAVLPEQAERVRGEVAARLLDARVAGDEAMVDVGATGPAALLEALRVRVDGPVSDATVTQPVPAAVLVAPQGDGWPRWFATVTDPSTAPVPAPVATAQPSDVPTDVSTAASAEVPSEPAGTGPSGSLPSGGAVEGPVEEAAVVPELPVLELYTSEDVRLPYRLWARLTLLPGAELPAFPDAELGAEPLAGGQGPSDAASGAPSAEASPPADGADAGADAEEDAGLLAAVTGLAARYASVLADGDSSPAAAEFEPDPFVEAVRARTVSEATAVQAVAGTTVEHGPLDGVEVLYAARAAGGDLLAVTAVETTTTMTVRSGSGLLRPGPEVRAAAGAEETGSVLTTRSVAALAFVVPAEQGAIRLVAVGEGLVSAEAGGQGTIEP